MNVRFDNGNLAVERFATECCFSLKKKILNSREYVKMHQYDVFVLWNGPVQVFNEIYVVKRM